MEDNSINAYSQEPPPYERLYVYLDEQYIYWYLVKHGIKIPSRFVLPINMYFPGHPQDVALWAQLIVFPLS